MKTWTCKNCEHINKSEDISCEICDFAKPIPEIKKWDTKNASKKTTPKVTSLRLKLWDVGYLLRQWGKNWLSSGFGVIIAGLFLAFVLSLILALIKVKDTADIAGSVVGIGLIIGLAIIIIGLILIIISIPLSVVGYVMQWLFR